MSNEFKYKSSDLINYLKHPLQFKSSLVFGNNYDDEEKLNFEFEPFLMDNLSINKVVKAIILDLIKIGINTEDDLGNEEYINAIKHKLNITNSLPKSSESNTDDLEIFSFTSLYACALDFFVCFKNITNRYPKEEDILKLDEVIINNKIIIPNVGDALIFDYDNKLCFIETLPLPSSVSLTSYLKLYINSLLYIAYKNEDIKYNIRLIKSEKKYKDFTISTSEAIGILESIINEIEDDVYRFIPTKKIESEYKHIINEKDDKLLNIFKLIEEKNSNSNGSTWLYFKDKKLFNDSDIGYSIKNYLEEYKESLNKYIELVEPLLKVETKEDK